MPNVLELSFGVDRNVWMLDRRVLQEGRREEDTRAEALDGAVQRGDLPAAEGREDKKERPRSIAEGLRKRFKVFVDESGSIGRRYARMDEVGTPFCITVDFDTVTEGSKNYGTVTVRERDGKTQERIKASDLAEYISKRMNPNA